MVDNYGFSSSTLFAMPSFLSGFARVLDIAGLFDSYNTSPSESEADAEAIRHDWQVVGDELRKALAAK